MKNKYKYIFRWEKFCSERNTILLTLEYNTDLSYNAIKNVLPAISYLPHEVRHHNIIKNFKKGAFNLQPPKTQYHAMWHVSILLNYLQNMIRESDMI